MPFPVLGETQPLPVCTVKVKLLDSSLKTLTPQNPIAKTPKDEPAGLSFTEMIKQSGLMHSLSSLILTFRSEVLVSPAHTLVVL